MQRHRDAAIVDGNAHAVAQQRHGMDVLTGAVDAAIGVDERVQRALHVAAGDAAIGQIEGRLGDVEDREILAGPISDDSGGGGRAGAAQQAGRQDRVAGGVGDRLTENLGVAGLQLDLDPAQRTGIAERAGEDVEAVGGGDGGQRDVGLHDQLRGVIVGIAALPEEDLVLRPSMQVGGIGGDDQIDAGLARFRRLAQREGGVHDLIAWPLDFHGARPDRSGGLIHQLVEGVLVVGGLGPKGFDHTRRQAVADAEYLDRDGIDIDGIDRHAGGGGFPAEDESRTAEADHFRPVAEVDRGFRRGGELGAIARGQAGRDLHLVFTREGQPVHAEGLVLHAELRVGGRRDFDPVPVMDLRPRIERAGEIQAGAGARVRQIGDNPGEAERSFRRGGLGQHRGSDDHRQNRGEKTGQTFH